VDEIWRVLRDPRVSTTLAFAVLATGGLMLFGLSWRGVAGTLFVVLQVPWIVSGAFGGMALLGLSLAMLVVHLDRTEAAAERAALASLQRDALRLLAITSERTAERG
jgi:F0F1-type ATP synthase assembly protein I